MLSWLINTFHRHTPNQLVSLDIETSSLDASSARLLSIGAVRVRAQQVILGEQFHCVIHTTEKDVEATAVIHGIMGHDVKQGVPILQALMQLNEFIGNDAILGYYHSFDRRVLNRALQNNQLAKLHQPGIELSEHYAQHWRHRHPTTPPNLAFEHICQQLSVPMLGRHTAIGDAISTALCWIALQQIKSNQSA